MNAIQFADNVKAAFKKHFPLGAMVCSQYCLGGGIYFSGRLIGDNAADTTVQGINDVLRVQFGIHENFKFNTETEIDGKIIVEFQACTISCLPESKYFAMQHKKIPARKINNTPEKAIAALDKLFAKAKEMVQAEAQANNLYCQDRIPQKYLDL